MGHAARLTVPPSGSPNAQSRSHAVETDIGTVGRMNRHQQLKEFNACPHRGAEEPAETQKRKPQRFRKWSLVSGADQNPKHAPKQKFSDKLRGGVILRGPIERRHGDAEKIVPVFLNADGIVIEFQGPTKENDQEPRIEQDAAPITQSPEQFPILGFYRKWLFAP